MSHYYSTIHGLIPHSTRTDLSLCVFIDDFLHPQSAYFKMIKIYELTGPNKDNTYPSIKNFMKPKNNKNIEMIFALRGRITKTGNYFLQYNGISHYLIKNSEISSFIANHPTIFKIQDYKLDHEPVSIKDVSIIKSQNDKHEHEFDSIKKNFVIKNQNDKIKPNSIKNGSETLVLIDNLTKLNLYYLSQPKIQNVVIKIESFIRHLEILHFNNEKNMFTYKKVTEYLEHLYKNREINYLMQVVEVTINEIEKQL
ncbi:hypothetical protein CDIK_1430 [Cucumispora dikerogammari]|nr:hypothetical protein CDIK_1430 [Cucumispora dikerogammari]